MPRTLNPMDGCPDCTWHEQRGERHLAKECALHEQIAQLQENYAMERSITKGLDRVMADVMRVINCDEEDDPVKVAQERMDEIKSLEEELAKFETAN
jgi:hypothetical protein